MSDAEAESMGYPLMIPIPYEFPLTLIAITIICMECVVIGFAGTGPARKAAFNPEFMKQFQSEHEAAFPGTEVSVGGFPDGGEGRYSKKLPYGDWVHFNNAVRVHKNFVEGLPLLISTLAICGLLAPKGAVTVGFLIAIGRPIYTGMYLNKGANARIFGLLVGSLPVYMLILWSLVEVIILMVRRGRMEADAA